MSPLKASAQKVQDALSAGGFTNEVIELETPARTSQEAADAVGCDVGQIAKSLIFITSDLRRAVLVITSGANRVDTSKVTSEIGEELGRANPEFVREQTGFAIGGIPPIGHSNPLLTFIDQDLLQYPFIWAAAGHPNALFKLAPADLVAMTGGAVLEVAA